MRYNLFSGILIVFVFLLGCSTPQNIPQGWKKYELGEISLYAPKGFKINAARNALLRGEGRIELTMGPVDLPSSLEENFMKAFNAYHYNKFFDQVLMDPKVKKMFRDSVTLANILTIEPGSISSCSNCNVVAQLKFKRKVFDFPVQMSEKVVNDHHCYMKINQSTDNFHKLTYIATDQCGSSKTYMYGESGSFTIIYTGLYSDELAISQSIRM